ncbi:MAG: hypothetical protein GEV10_05870 [Streptosporangiales bacterium]|nr:hypothetical protein [Streptosporangiales bacterium]
MTRAGAGTATQRAGRGQSPLWWASTAAVGMLCVVLVVGGILLVTLASSRDDPHGYVTFFSVLVLALLLPPTIFALAGIVGLLRRRRHGYVCAGVAHAWVALDAALVLGMNTSSPGSDGISAWEIFLPALIVSIGVAFAIVSVLGARNVAP